MTSTKKELAWAILGHPIEWADAMWPVTVCDTQGIRVRYQKMPKDQLADLRLQGGMAKFTAFYLGDEWRLLDMVADTATEAI